MVAERVRRSALSLTMVALALGCAPADESASLRLLVDATGAIVAIHAASSASGVDVTLDWSMTVENYATQPCAVAIYAWTDTVPDDPTLPSVTQAWPDTWQGAELLGFDVVEPGERIELVIDLAPELSEALIGEGVTTVLGFAACPSADLRLDVHAEVEADLGVRAISDALILELWRL